MHIRPHAKFEISDEPALRFCGNGHRWELTEQVKLHWVGTHHDLLVIIPIGFKTDLASVPRFLWWLFPSAGEYNRAAIIHDYLCEEPRTDRVFADAMFKVIMRRTGVKWYRWIPMFLAVRTYGAMVDAWRTVWTPKTTA